MAGMLDAAMHEKELKYHFQIKAGKQNICLFYHFGVLLHLAYEFIEDSSCYLLSTKSKIKTDCAICMQLCYGCKGTLLKSSPFQGGKGKAQGVRNG